MRSKHAGEIAGGPRAGSSFQDGETQVQDKDLDEQKVTWRKRGGPRAGSKMPRRRNAVAKNQEEKAKSSNVIQRKLAPQTGLTPTAETEGGRPLLRHKKGKPGTEATPAKLGEKTTFLQERKFEPYKTGGIAQPT